MPSFSFEGRAKVAANIREFQSKFTRAQARSLKRIAEEKILAPALELVPIAEGDLYDSGRVEVSPKGRSVTVLFGGPGIPQAVPVHEHPSEASPPSWQAAEAAGRPVQFHRPGSGPKFLQRPWMEEASNYLGDLAQDLKVDTLS